MFDWEDFCCVPLFVPPVCFFSQTNLSRDTVLSSGGNISSAVSTHCCLLLFDDDGRDKKIFLFTLWHKTPNISTDNQLSHQECMKATKLRFGDAAFCLNGIDHLPRKLVSWKQITAKRQSKKNKQIKNDKQ